MKKRFLGFLLLPLILSGCGASANSEEIDTGSYETHSIEHPLNTGEIAAFDLLTPTNEFSTGGAFSFTWEVANNANYYNLEIASTVSFVSDDEDEVYVRETNLSNTKFDLTYYLPKKDITYYWRVTAVNKDHTKKSTSVNHFFYEAPNIDEIPIEIEDEQDWVLHKEGSYADIKVDRSNFFGNNKNSLAIIFDKEHTNQGIAKSDGWIVVTKTEDRELYGTDSFFFNFYYSGHDATVLVRVLDYDGEYWHKQVQISNNSKQTILMKYDEFELRTSGGNVFNRVFDWEHIRYFEIVFERTFGDGICLFSDIKAVKYENYKDMFMDKMDFRSTNMSDWTYENYNFPKTISEDGSELTLSYSPYNAETNPTGMKDGYGFQNANVYKYFVQGDALRMKVKFTGSSNGAVFYFRILEEDTDRWQFKLPFSNLVRDQYKEIVIPLKAFQRTDYMSGDGAKQFYYIQKFNIGLAQNYATGTLSVKDIEVAKIDNLVDNRIRTVTADGVIDNFDSYDIYTELYYFWDQSTVNKDEAMKLDTTHKAGGNNKYCAEFDYKADMEQAVYQLYMDSTAATGKNAFSIWLKDASPRSTDAAVSYLTDEEVAAELTIQLTLDTGEWYRYIIPKLNKDWKNYTIPFSEFFLENERELLNDPLPLTSDHIVHMAFGFKYLFYDQQGNHHPTYAIANPVYLDNICLTNASAYSMVDVPGSLQPDSDDNTRITIETMELFNNDTEVFNDWSFGNAYEFNELHLSNDVSSEGGSKSLKMHYKSYESVSYVRSTLFKRSTTAKGFSIDIKGDNKATVYINLNWRVGNNTLKMRYTLLSITNTWKRYVIGVELFKDVTNNSNKKLSKDDIKDIESISFGIVNGDYSASAIYVDNIRMLTNVGYTAETVTPIA